MKFADLQFINPFLTSMTVIWFYSCFLTVKYADRPLAVFYLGTSDLGIAEMITPV
jgi:hypothetical protein